MTFHQVHHNLREEDQNFLFVWLLLLLLRIWGTIRFFIYVSSKQDGSELYMKVLLHLQAVGDPAQAFCNSILFCVCDRTVRKKICALICTCKSSGDLNDRLTEEGVDRKNSLNA